MNDLRTAFDEYVAADEPPMGLTSGTVLAAAAGRAGTGWPGEPPGSPPQ